MLLWPSCCSEVVLTVGFSSVTAVSVCTLTCLSVCEYAAIVALAKALYHRLHHISVHLLPDNSIDCVVPGKAGQDRRS